MIQSVLFKFILLQVSGASCRRPVEDILDAFETPGPSTPLSTLVKADGPMMLSITPAGAAPASRCVYYRKHGSPGMLLPATDFPTPSYCSKTKNGAGIECRVVGGDGIGRPGSGDFFISFRVRRAGCYYTTLRSSAPHGTEHNDVWIRMSADFNLLRPNTGSWRRGNNGWYKAYQNEGKRKIAQYALTVNFDGHQLISNPLETGKVYHVCLSVRSSRFRIYEIDMVHCGGRADCDRYEKKIR